MKKRVFNIKTNELGINSENYIRNVYDSFIPKGKNTILTLKGAVSPWHKDLFRFTADNNKERSPYEMITDYVTEDISAFYTKIINRVDGQLKGYGERADKLRNQYRNDFEKSMQTTIQKIMEEIERCAVMQADSSIVMKRVNTVLEKRRNELQKHLEDVYLQIARCVVLWKYEDNGYIQYSLFAPGENCDPCNLMSGRIFNIKQAMPYINFPPLHPNCDCQVNILDENGDTVRVLDSEGKFIMEELDDFMEYVKSVLGKAILGDFSDAEYTPEALILSSIAGFTGADVPMDIRDVVASVVDMVQNGPNEENKQDLIWNGLAIIPFAGATKYVKKIPGVEKHIDEAVEVVTNALKHGDDVEEVVKITLKHKATSGVELISTPNKTTTILGRYGSDTGAIIKELQIPKNIDFSGNPGGFNLLNTPDYLYDKLGADGFWEEYNKPFLDAAIKRGDEIIIATPITNDNLYLPGTTELTGFGREYFYLLDCGYEYIDGKMVLK